MLDLRLELLGGGGSCEGVVSAVRDGMTREKGGIVPSASSAALSFFASSSLALIVLANSLFHSWSRLSSLCRVAASCSSSSFCRFRTSSRAARRATLLAGVVEADDGTATWGFTGELAPVREERRAERSATSARRDSFSDL